jgi:hypothetical protein
MSPVILAAADSGDTATWVGSIGTWFVGLVAGTIAWRQYEYGRFRPEVRAYRDDRGRIAVRLANRGAGSGSVEYVDLLPARRPRPDTPLIAYRWEVDGKPAADLGSSPFTLAGASTAQLVLLAADPADITGETHVRVRFGNGRRSTPCPLKPVSGHVYGSTNIAGQPVASTPGDRAPSPRRRSRQLGALGAGTGGAGRIGRGQRRSAPGRAGR